MHLFSTVSSNEVSSTHMLDSGITIHEYSHRIDISQNRFAMLPIIPFIFFVLPYCHPFFHISILPVISVTFLSHSTPLESGKSDQWLGSKQKFTELPHKVHRCTDLVDELQLPYQPKLSSEKTILSLAPKRNTITPHRHIKLINCYITVQLYKYSITQLY